MSTEVCPSGREIKAKHQTGPLRGGSTPQLCGERQERSLRRCSKFTPQFLKSGSRPSRSTRLPHRLFWVRAVLSASPKLERSQGHLKPGQGGLRLLTAKFSERPPGAQAKAVQPLATPIPPSRGSRGRSRGPHRGPQSQRRGRPEPRTEGGRASDEGGSQPVPAQTCAAPRVPPAEARTPRPAAGLRSAGPPGR